MKRPDQWIRIALVGAICLTADPTFAQPGAPPPPPPDDPYGPAPGEPLPPPDAPPPPPGPAEPAPPGAPAPPPPGPYGQPPGYAQPPPYGQPPPPPPGIQRQGWFIGFSIGAGSISMTDNSIESESYGGMQFDLRFGGMIGPRFGLMLDLGLGAYSIDEEAEITLSQTRFGIAGQYWVIPQLWLRLGVGASKMGISRRGDQIGDPLDGMLLSAAIGYELWQGRRFALDLSLHAAAGRYDPDVEDVGTTNAGLAIGFNWY